MERKKSSRNPITNGWRITHLCANQKNGLGNFKLSFHLLGFHVCMPISHCMCMSLTVDSKGKQERMNENKYVKVSGLLLGVEGKGGLLYSVGCERR